VGAADDTLGVADVDAGNDTDESSLWVFPDVIRA